MITYPCSLHGRVYFLRTAGLLVYGLLVCLTVYVGRVRWVEPRRRSVVTAFGFAASTSSLLVILVLAIHALLTGGFPYYSPPLMLAFRIGFLTALAGVIAAMVGKGLLEVPSVIRPPYAS